MAYQNDRYRRTNNRVLVDDSASRSRYARSQEQRSYDAPSYDERQRSRSAAGGYKAQERASRSQSPRRQSSYQQSSYQQDPRQQSSRRQESYYQQTSRQQGSYRQSSRQRDARSYDSSDRYAQPSNRYRAQSQPRRGSQPARDTTLRNRIILVVALVLLVALLVGLVTCVANGLGGAKSQSPQAASSGVAVTTSSAASQSSQQSSAAAVPAGTGVEDKWVAGGRFTTGDAELDQLIKQHCDNWTSDDLSQADNAFNAYCNAIWADYVERDNNQHPVGPNWDVEYAKQFFHEGSCNCYEQVAVGEFILKYFGYTDVYGEPCNVLRQSGTYGEHGILFVTDLDGRKCLCDPSFGANGWMLDADSYTMEIVDIGQDSAEFKIANFERVAEAPWIEA